MHQPFNPPQPKEVTYVSIDQNVLNTDSNILETVSTVVELNSIDDRLSLDSNDFRLERIIDSGAINQLKDIPQLSLNALSMTDVFTRGASILSNIKNNIEQ